MSQRKELITIEYHSDDDTGMYKVGEIDYGISGQFDEYVKRYGRDGLKEILLTLSFLTWYVQENGYSIVKENEPSQNAGTSVKSS